MFRACTLFSLFALLPACGCRTTPAPPDLGGLYNRSASHHGPNRNPIIVIPGILGSRLVDEAAGRLVWGAFSGDYANPNSAEGARLVALPMASGAPLSQLTDRVVPSGALDRLKIDFFGLPLESEAYAYILKTLGVGGYRDESLGASGAVDYGAEHYTCFQFDYDWRRDNVENAARLHQFILARRRYVQAEIEKRYGVKDHDVKFDIIAHSMGGLLTRYYLRYGDAQLPDDGPPPVTWAGRRHVDRVVLVGTPNAGSAHALVQLVEGIRFSAVLPKYPAAILCTFPSIFQLLPRRRHAPLVEAGDTAQAIPEDILDPELWVKMNWGLADPRQDATLKVLLPEARTAGERREIALDHLRKSLSRARRFFDALDSPDAAIPGAPHVHVVVGDAVATPAALAVDRATGRLSVAATAPGDGTVTRASTLLDERAGQEWSPTLRSPIRWGHVTFLFSDHLGLTRDPAFTDNVLYLLLEEPRGAAD